MQGRSNVPPRGLSIEGESSSEFMSANEDATREDGTNASPDVHATEGDDTAPKQPIEGSRGDTTTPLGADLRDLTARRARRRLKRIKRRQKAAHRRREAAAVAAVHA